MVKMTCWCSNQAPEWGRQVIQVTFYEAWFTEKCQKKRKYQVNGTSLLNAFLMSENGQTGASWWKGSNSNNYSLQLRNADEHLWIFLYALNAQHVEPWSRWAVVAEDNTGCHFCQQGTGEKLNNRTLGKFVAPYNHNTGKNVFKLDLDTEFHAYRFLQDNLHLRNISYILHNIINKS